MAPPVALITGCSSGGIGHALALALHGHGCIVYASARNPDIVDPVPAKVASSSRWHTLQLDVTVETSIKLAVSTVIKEQGRIDILVNNAGYAHHGPVAEFPMDQARKLYETNVFSVMACCQAVVPHMAAAHGGKIINIGSITGIQASPFSGVYASTKAALHSLSSALSMELRPFGVKVMVVAPGAIKSKLLDGMLTRADLSHLKLYKAYAEPLIQAFARINQSMFTPTEDFAAALAKQIMKREPPAWWTWGKYSTIFWFFSCIPKWIPQYFLAKDAGLLRHVSMPETAEPELIEPAKSKAS